MAKRAPLPDVLGDLLAEKPILKRAQEHAPKYNNASVTEHQKDESAAQHRSSITASPTFQQQDRERDYPAADAEVGKTKATFYLSREITQALEDAWLHLRRRTGKGRPASKSVLVEAALRMTLPKLMETGVELQANITIHYQPTSTP
jgi:hypothetical protein